MWMALLAAARLTVLAFLALPAAAVAGEPCREDAFEGARYTICSFDPADADMRMFWRDSEGQPFRAFPALVAELAEEGLTLVFAMNGGMYDTDLSPLGLYIEKGVEHSGTNTAEVDARPVPNFYKKPNGIFMIAGDRAAIIETEAYLRKRPAVDFATQSGPLLVIGGALHSAFIPDSNDLNRRDGVGIDDAGMVHFAISEDPVNFHTFARFFRDFLGTDDALFFDGGSAPGLYSPDLSRSDWPGHGGYGPIVGVVVPK